MNKNTLFEIILFDPENTLITLLEKQNIEFRKLTTSHKFLVATDKTISIVSKENNEVLIKSLVLIFMEWLKMNQDRKLQAQLIDGTIVYIVEHNIEANTNILNNLLKVNAFDPEYNNRIRNR